MSGLKVGLVGCGVISDVYLRSAAEFDNFTIVVCSDLNSELAETRARQYHIKAVGLDELLKSADIQLILNLTPPAAHKQINLRALAAGMHVYSEKPFALSVEDAEETLVLANKLGLHVGSAPDSFLGQAHQTAKKIIEDGLIGRITAGSASLLNFCGYRSDHPGLGFFFQPGGGPLLDMGPYYLASLVDLLGPVKRVAAVGKRTFDKRVCHEGLNAGKSYPVGVDTHISSLLEFFDGTLITYSTSFDIWAHHMPRIELYGTNGSIRLPEPSGFGGEVTFIQIPGGEWKTADPVPGCAKILRGLGLSEMIDAINNNRIPKCSGAFAAYIIKIMCALNESAASGTFIDLDKPVGL